MAEYKVTQVNVDGEPREWKGPKGTVYYIGVMLDKHDKPVSIGKKAPDALKIGDTVYGEIEATDYLTDKWKHGEAPQASVNSQDAIQTDKYLKDTSDIPYRVFAELLKLEDYKSFKENAEYRRMFFEIVQDVSNELLTMIENVRSGSPEYHPTKGIKEDSLPAAEPLIKQKLNRGFSEPELSDDDYQD